jgi:SPP1 family predicted phage head-tail adaptor
MSCAKKYPSSGELRHLVEFKAISATSDGAGGQTETLAVVASAYAKIDPKRGMERLSSGQMEAYTYYKVVCRYDAAITPATRMVWDGKELNIKSVLNMDARNRFMEITAVEGEL